MKVFALGIVLALSLLAGRANSAEKCGEKQIIAQQLISYGYKALAGGWPWHGALFHKQGGSNMYACGVTILTEQFVITAAHCTIDQYTREKIPANRVFIKVGITNLDKPDRHTQEHKIDRIIRHEEFILRILENDIALLKLRTVIEYNSYVQPICLWQGDTSLSKIEYRKGYVVGWGRDENFGSPKNLNEATFPIVSKKDCIDSDPKYYRMVYFESKTFCAGHRNGTQAGPGDSGGGLFLPIGDRWFLRGIVSNTKPFRNTLQVHAESFVVFTDVSYYLYWIRSHVTIESATQPSQRPPGYSGNQDNLLDIANCGKDTYPSGTPEEVKGYLNQYPWLAVIEYINSNTRVLEDTCHAVLIHPSFLVTAGFCVQNRLPSTIFAVRLNDYRLDTVKDIFEINGKTIETTATRIHVRGVFVHPDYNHPKFANSIALIKLERPTTANPICLPPVGSTLLSVKKFTIIGWKKHPRKEKPLIRNVVQLANFGVCWSKYAEVNTRLDPTGGQVCSTYSHDDDSENCSHYMGSAPFQYVRDGPSKGRYFLAAISSFGHRDCQRYDYPDVFTNVPHYADWIEHIVMRHE